MMKIDALKWLLCLFLLESMSLVQAGQISNYLQKQTQEIVNTVIEKKDYFEKNPSKFRHFLLDRSGQLFHFRYMGQFAAGKYWRQMSKQQQQQYIEEFTLFLINSYGRNLLILDSPEITFADETPARKKKRYWVDMMAKVKGEEFNIRYEVADTKQGYKIINIKALGISLLVNFRKSFSDIAKQKGVSGLIERLQQQNEKLS